MLLLIAWYGRFRAFDIVDQDCNPSRWGAALSKPIDSVEKFFKFIVKNFLLQKEESN